MNLQALIQALMGGGQASFSGQAPSMPWQSSPMMQPSGPTSTPQLSQTGIYGTGQGGIPSQQPPMFGLQQQPGWPSNNSQAMPFGR